MSPYIYIIDDLVFFFVGIVILLLLSAKTQKGINIPPEAL